MLQIQKYDPIEQKSLLTGRKNAEPANASPKKNKIEK